VPGAKPLPKTSIKLKSKAEPNVGLKEVIVWPETRLVQMRTITADRKDREFTLILLYLPPFSGRRLPPADYLTIVEIDAKGKRGNYYQEQVAISPEYFLLNPQVGTANPAK
jgi:hypothetical protein